MDNQCLSEKRYCEGRGRWLETDNISAICYGFYTATASELITIYLLSRPLQYRIYMTVYDKKPSLILTWNRPGIENKSQGSVRNCVPALAWPRGLNSYYTENQMSCIKWSVLCNFVTLTLYKCSTLDYRFFITRSRSGLISSVDLKTLFQADCFQCVLAIWLIFIKSKVVCVCFCPQKDLHYIKIKLAIDCLQDLLSFRSHVRGK